MAQRQGGGWLATWSVFFFGSIILNVPGTEALKFIGKLDHFATAYLSFSMDFNCTTDDPAATVALLHSQGIGALTERSLSPNKLILDGQVFTVLNLAVNDAGRYACRATDQSGISITSTELHRILQRATLPREFGLVPNKALTIMQGHSASIVCYGSPQKLPFSLTWEKQTNGSYVSVDQSMLKRDQSNQRVAAILTIANAKSSDSGIYKCTVAVEHLSTFRLTSVQVKVPSSPTIIEPTTRDRVIMEGQEQTIKCDAEGAPKPVVTWYKNGQQLKKTQCFKGPDSCQDIYEVFEAGETSPNFTSSTYGRLKIVSALYTRDQGEFKCVASNGNLPKAELIFNLDVTVKPHLRKELDDKVRYVNENLKTQVSCKVVKSNPLPTFSWFYQNFICDKSHVQECVPDERKWKPVPPEKIHNASIPSFESFVDIDSDQGNSYYQCKASSSLGNDSLVIIFKRAASEKPKVEVDRTITKTEYNEKSTLKIYCFDRCGGICGNYFSKDGKFLSHADNPRVNITSDHDEFGGQKGVLLTITNMTMNDSGQYECGLLVPRYFARINITVKGTEALKFIGQLDPYGTAYLGFSMEFNCTTDDPAATVALLHSQGFGALTERSLSPNKLILDGQVFTVLNLAVADAGRYACRATDQSGTSITSSQLYRVLHRAKLPREFGLVPKKALTIMQGHSASIVCYASFEMFPFSLTWEKQTTFGSYVSVDPSMVKRDQSNQLLRAILTVANAKLSDSGIYKCTVAVKHVSTFKVTAVQVKAPSAPTITKPTTRDIVVMEGQQQTVKCDAEGAPKPVVTWYKNGQQLKKTQCTKDPDSCQDIVCEVFEVGETSPNFTRSTYGRLKIVSALYQRDQGEFKCVASNGNLPLAELIFNLDVTVKPHLRKELDDKVRYVNENLKTQVSCQVVKSNPLPTFSWFYQIFICDKLNLQECVPDERRWKPVPLNKIFPNASIPSLKSFVNIDSDQGNSYYQCKASSSLGSDSLVIIFKRSGNDELIKVVAGSEKYDEGQTLQLQCIITRKVSVVSWFKDNKQLNADSGGRITVLSTKLSVKGLMANDSGLYTCLAKDSSGQNLNGSLFITIKKTYSPTILYFNNETAYHQTTVKLFCNVSGYPIPKINWFKDNVPLGNRIEEENRLESCEGFVEGFTYQINDPFYVGLLVICHPSHAQHSGFYTCQASNQAGGTNATAFLNVLEDSVIVSPREELRRQPVQVNLGEPWNATCKATGNPAPKMEWRKQYSSHTLPTTQHGSKGVVLKIEAVAEKDLGIYLCLAENGLGKDNASIELVLAANPELPVVSHSVLFRKDTIIVVSVVAVAVFCLLVLSISLFVCIRRQKKILIKYRNELFPKYCGEPQLDPDRSIFEQYNSLPYDPMWEFPEDRLSLGETLGSGLFGQVIKAEAMGITEFNPRNKRREKVQRRSNSFRRYGSSRRYVELPKTTVAVKTLKANATLEEYRDLASELKILIHIGEHKNIVNLLGACTKGNRLLVIMEYAPHGNLGDFLRSRRHMFEPVWGRTAVLDPELDLNISHLVNFSYEVCRGMEFLASKKCIHRDLAARNVLVGEEYVMKIADFGLARDIHATNEYVKTTDGVFPAKWMALESLFSKVYSEKSDVWSFGICLWEIFTLGGSPYHMIVTECLLDFLSEGNRMESPQDCPDEFYAVMNDCWRKEAKDRPSFAELSERIGEIIERHASEQGYPAYIIFTGDNRGNQSDYVNPVECDTSASQHGAAAGYSRVLSGETTHCSLLSSVVENDCNPEADEREQMLVAEASGSLSGNESGIDVEENGNDMATIAMEMRPLKSANEKRRKKQNSQQSFA